MYTTMQYRSGDIWELAHACEGLVVVPTNTTIRKDGLAVMGAGLAKNAADKFPSLPQQLATHINRWNERLYVDQHVICLPTKRDWQQSSTIELVEQGCRELAELDRIFTICGYKRPILVPQLGCGLGGLKWERQVRPVVDSLLESERFILVSKP